MLSKKKKIFDLELQTSHSPEIKKTSVTSPVTDLTLNLSELTTESIFSTPRKQCNDTDDMPFLSRRSILGSLQLSTDTSDSPLAVDSPMFQERVLRDFKIDSFTSSGRQRVLKRRKSLPAEKLQSTFTNLPRCTLNLEEFACEPKSSASSSSTELGQPSTSFSSSSSLIANGYCDDGFSEVSDTIENDENVPCGMLELLTAPIIQPGNVEIQQKGKKQSSRSIFRRFLPMKSHMSVDEDDTLHNVLSKSPSAPSLFSSKANQRSKVECANQFILCNSLFDSKQSLPSQVIMSGFKSDGSSRNRQIETYNAFLPHISLLQIQGQRDLHKDFQSAFKRPEPPKSVGSPIQIKRRKSLSCCTDSGIIQSGLGKKPVQRSSSETEASIIKALQKSDLNPNLIGDFSKPFALPLVEGKCRELKNISPDTMAQLITGHYDNVINKYTIVDCRYPYEFEGGHIIGAKNIYTKPGIVQEFFKNERKPSEKNWKHIIVFHCEFSSERGPTLCKFLREMDRQANKEHYPHLFHPEIYVLNGGYKAFYEKYWEFCEPQQYKPMKHKDHKYDLCHFRAKSKSWNE
ncbi:M-phase inducer phosphatase 1-B-like [Limulus polyphemus]|uniref:M-phase inducer phosphatase n=1 Tax=Limulus polyphemus TaxID=6850 RepID=A0ABM1T1A8_LIMPO|nr:M-phase inducer phosphatase 1-B-like [Limulus polyphemus]XP_022249664.1 M-phase inducer phosphatase 1-B-like [Limulus polyphemus]